ncbi:Hypothetical protein IALB_1620 [Ignavibacterium album JCM 16511]|uniref:Uncharacterized protein n=1 Tax=Ignavibacterium album (strain DSM 19864 / JCM 16511 / NBRC 101810 / Mat9-16) TaxID=945713 RepID=I0AK21_IGNAJ|nr:hypothetical protein [Ignavibacterium album]AFH49328.1 Hypothetical protein IALB_1620 [Ignavibacterium album JCM 16511]
MEFIKQYITQSISAAANSLRLSTHQIEIVALLKDAIIKSENLGNDLIKMKKITELSTLAIKLNEIYNFLNQNTIDFFKISDQFKDHSRNLIKDLNHLLDTTTPLSFKNALEKLNPKEEELKTASPQEINVDLSKRKVDDEIFLKPETEKIKEKIILDDENDNEELFIQNFETNILKPVKPLDQMLKNLAKDDFDYEEISSFIKVMSDNGRLSKKIGFEIISDMHETIAQTLTLIKNRRLMPGKEIIEGLRACLIVIVAVVKGKEVDITNYLNRADELQQKISKIK